MCTLTDARNLQAEPTSLSQHSSPPTSPRRVAAAPRMAAAAVAQRDLDSDYESNDGQYNAW